MSTGGKDVDKLLSMMRRAPAQGAQVRPEVAQRAYDTAFDTLPQYQQIKFQREFAAFAALEVPYYRLHAGRSAATALIGNRELVNFASYDYLGLNGHPAIVAAAEAATREFGTSVSASRISAGERQVHRDLEQLLAKNYAAEDCIVFNSGHGGGVSTIASLVGPKDLIVHDALIHNCIVVGAQLSGATRRNFPHNDLDALERLLASERPRFERCLIVTEGLFSMDGDGPDLARLIEIKQRFGAWLMMDDAHALGVLGATGRGIFEHQGIAPDSVDLWFGTLSKTLVGCGGYVAGSAVLVDLLKCHAPSFVYSVGMPAAVAAASAKALEIMNAEPERVAKLQANSQRFLKRAKALGLDTGDAWGYGIIPVIVGETVRTLVLAQELQKRGFNAFPILPPGVPEKSSRLRFFINATHSDAQIDAAVDAVAETLDAVKDVSAMAILKQQGQSNPG
ncbi:MAG: aminotransferase class I [Beijerinckiaceae bacterium]|nr:MAG: aminotransferase class I [Beijerinckiaceae bacterium]